MTNPFTVQVPSILDALSQFDKGYAWGTERRKEGQLRDAGRSLQKRDFGSAIDQLMGAGQLDAGIKVMGLQEAERTRGLQAQADQAAFASITGIPSASGQSASAPQSWGNAIAGIESGGRYDALGPLVTKSGDRAYGKYQVMGNNIPEWTQAALGKRMTPQEFLADPQAQDAVFKHRFGQYAAKYGPEGAARAWFAGEGGMNNPNAKDQLGTSVQQYGQRFAQAAGVPASGADPAAMPPNAQLTQGYAIPGQQQAGGPNLSPRARNLLGAMARPNLSANARDALKLALNQEFEQNKTPEAVRQYLFAKGDGYRGSYLDFQRDLKRTNDDPRLVELFDENTGQPYKARYDSKTGEYTRVGGVKAPTGMQITTNKDGTVSLTQGPMKGGKLTEQQSKDSVFLTRAVGAMPVLDALGDKLASFSDSVGGKAPLVGNYLKSKEYQQAEQAGREWMMSILRKDTGAAITKEEESIYGDMYLPRPGDDKAVLTQKKAARQRATQAIQLGLPPEAILNLERAGVSLVQGGGSTEPQAQPSTPAPPTGFRIIE